MSVIVFLPTEGWEGSNPKPIPSYTGLEGISVNSFPPLFLVHQAELFFSDGLILAGTFYREGRRMVKSVAIALVPMALVGMKELLVPDPSLWR